MKIDAGALQRPVAMIPRKPCGHHSSLLPLVGTGSGQAAVYAGGLPAGTGVGGRTARARRGRGRHRTRAQPGEQAEAALLRLRPTGLRCRARPFGMRHSPAPASPAVGLSFPHRQADAYLRDATLRARFPKTPVAGSDGATADQPSALLQWFSPPALRVLAVAQGEAFAGQAARSWVSEIRSHWATRGRHGGRGVSAGKGDVGTTVGVDGGSAPTKTLNPGASRSRAMRPRQLSVDEKG